MSNAKKTDTGLLVPIYSTCK